MTSASSDGGGRGDELSGPDDVRSWLAAEVFCPTAGDDTAGAIGLEVEFFPFWTTRAGRPAARLALVEMVALLDDVAERDPEAGDGRPSWHRDDVLITEEPGAQLELAGPPDPDAPTALTRLEKLADELAVAFESAGAVLASAGLDLWSDPDEVPVQLEIPRYEAMSAYFGSRGGRHGHLLMCASCSIQVNLDLGPPDVARSRWLLANLAAPVFTAVFAASPTTVAVNGRAMGWRGLDPTRTGVSPALVDGDPDPVEHVLLDVLRADVMMVARDGEWIAGGPGWRFVDWLRDGHDRFGPPTTEDLRTHLTTLFPEARLRGFLEIRTIDALPRPWRRVAIELVTALFYEPVALREAVEILEPLRSGLPDLLARAAEEGLADAQLAESAQRIVGLGIEAMEELGYPAADVAREYSERYTARHRSPSDDLRAQLSDDAAGGFGWAVERVP